MALYDKLYICRQEPPFTPANIRGTWDESGIGPINVLDGRKDSGNLLRNRSRPDSNATSPYRVMLCRAISLPLASNQSIGGTVNVAIRVSESHADADMHWKAHMYVTEGDTDNIRGTLINNYEEAQGVNEFPTALTGHAFNAAVAVNTVNAVAGDRIVLEIGFIAYNAVSTLYNGNFAEGTYQDTTTVYADQVVGNTAIGAPHVIFSSALDFEVPAAPANDLCVNATDVSSLPYSDIQDNTSATASGDDPTNPFGANKTIWYKWTAPSDLWVTFHGDGAEVRDSADGLFGQDIAVYTGSCGSFTLFEFASGSLHNGFKATNGVTYYFMITVGSLPYGGRFAFNLASEPLTGGPPSPGATVIYQQSWATTFSRNYWWQQHDPLGTGYEPLTGYPYPNGIAEAENIAVAVAGTMDIADAGYAGGFPYTACGAAFYGIGENDPNRYQVPDDNTYAWDQRDVVVQVDYNFKTGVMEEGSIYYPIVLAKGLFSSTAAIILAVYGDGWNEFSRKWELEYHTGNPGSQQGHLVDFSTYTPDNQWHTLTLRAQPGTITGDPLQAGHTVASDGFIHIWIDNDLLYQVNNIALTFGFGNSDSYTRSPVHVRSLWQGYFGLLGPTRSLSVTRLDSVPITVPPMQRASYVFFSNTITEKQVETRLTRTYLQMLVSNPDASTPGPGVLTLTNIIGNLYDQNGNVLTTGRLYITPRNIITVGSQFLISKQTVTYNVTGPINLFLAPSNTVIYNVEFDPNPADPRPINLKPGYWFDQWLVPFGGPVDIATL